MSQRGSRRVYHGHHKRNKVNLGDKGKEILENIDENNPVIQQFRMYAIELDNKHDKFERITKHSRDVTIESKRIIFLLHTLDRNSKKDSILGESKSRLDNLGTSVFKNIALELDNQDPYQYLRAYRIGLEEYIEAVTFYQYLMSGGIKDWMEIEKALTYFIPSESEELTENNDQQMKTVKTLITPTEYILGVADLTGELMRKCINNLTSGDITSCNQTCSFVRDLYKGLLGIVGVPNKEINRKLYTLKLSLMKMENVCYTIRVRGSEIPKHMLADAALEASEEYAITDDDEGYQPY